MIFDRQKLLVALKQCSAGIGTDVEENNTFTFFDGRIYASNNKVTISKIIDFCNEPILNFSVNATDFIKIVEKFKSDEIKVEITDDCLNLKCEKSKVKLPFMNFDFSEKFKYFKDIDGWEDVDENIINGVIMCRIANNKFTSSGIYVSGNYIYCTDCYQVNKYRLNKFTKDFYISEEVANEIVKFNDFKKIKIDNWVHFKDDNETIFSFKIMETEKYPVEKLNNILSVSNDLKKYTLPTELIDVIDRASVFGFDIESRNIIKLKFYENKIEVCSERTSGTFSEEMELNYSFDFDEPVSVLMDNNMLIYALKNNMTFSIVEGDEVKVYLTTEFSEHIMCTFEEN